MLQSVRKEERADSSFSFCEFAVSFLGVCIKLFEVERLLNASATSWFSCCSEEGGFFAEQH